MKSHMKKDSTQLRLELIDAICTEKWHEPGGRFRIDQAIERLIEAIAREAAANEVRLQEAIHHLAGKPFPYPEVNQSEEARAKKKEREAAQLRQWPYSEALREMREAVNALGNMARHVGHKRLEIILEGLIRAVRGPDGQEHALIGRIEEAESWDRRWESPLEHQIIQAFGIEGDEDAFAIANRLNQASTRLRNENESLRRQLRPFLVETSRPDDAKGIDPGNGPGADSPRNEHTDAPPKREGDEGRLLANDPSVGFGHGSSQIDSTSQSGSRGGTGSQPPSNEPEGFRKLKGGRKAFNYREECKEHRQFRYTNQLPPPCGGAGWQCKHCLMVVCSSCRERHRQFCKLFEAVS